MKVKGHGYTQSQERFLDKGSKMSKTYNNIGLN